jgi:hypothetical protein
MIHGKLIFREACTAPVAHPFGNNVLPPARSAQFSRFVLFPANLLFGNFNDE